MTNIEYVYGVIKAFNFYCWRKLSNKKKQKFEKRISMEYSVARGKTYPWESWSGKSEWAFTYAARKQMWAETVEAMNFKQPRREAWSLLLKLWRGNVAIRGNLVIRPNAIASHNFPSSMAPRDGEHATEGKHPEFLNLNKLPANGWHSNIESILNIESISRVLKQR